ncbi:MAG: transposase [Elusimicrobia bacterium]|nr:transposase [Elusimicrobiota bacterium]
MPRGPRIFFENAHYHIMDRGNDKGDIFSSDLDRIQYLSLLRKVKHDFGLLLPAFALMSNHIHLYFVTPKTNLSEAMFALNNAYSHYFNKEHGKTGHLFEGRYKYKLIQTDKYSLALTRYIHLNPVKAGLAAKPEAYTWSSAAQYVGKDDGFGFADKAVVLDPLSDSPAGSLVQYLEYLAAPIPGKLWRPFDKNRNAVLGDREFRAAHSPHR